LEQSSSGGVVVKNQSDWKALKKWYRIPEDIRKKLEHNVYCGFCSGVTAIKDYEIVISENGNTLLEGKCAKCDGRVRRVVD